jgi:hypothetical protein
MGGLPPSPWRMGRVRAAGPPAIGPRWRSVGPPPRRAGPCAVKAGRVRLEPGRRTGFGGGLWVSSPARSRAGPGRDGPGRDGTGRAGTGRDGPGLGCGALPLPRLSRIRRSGVSGSGHGPWPRRGGRESRREPAPERVLKVLSHSILENFRHSLRRGPAPPRGQVQGEKARPGGPGRPKRLALSRRPTTDRARPRARPRPRPMSAPSDGSLQESGDDEN